MLGAGSTVPWELSAGPSRGDATATVLRSTGRCRVKDERRADARLADRIRSGDAEALGELYDRYASIALATALRVVGGRDEAEDVVHDAFVAVWRKIDRFDAGRGSLRGWLMTVVRNRAIDRVRARRATIDVDAADERSLLRTGPNPTWEDALRSRGSR